MAGGIKTLICKYPSSGPNPDALLLQVDPLTWVPLLARVRRVLRVFWASWVTFPGSAESRGWVLLHQVSRTGGVRRGTAGSAVVPRESAWPWPQADEQERLDGQAREENPMFTQAHWPNSPCGRASAAGRARPPSRSAVECVFIYILPGEAAWGLMVGTAAAQRALGAAVVPSWLGMGLHTSLPGDSRSRWALGRWNRS